MRALVDAERAGRLVRMGNWSLGRALGHLAAWIGFGYDGYPMRIPFPIRILLRPLKRRMIHKPMPPGVRIPRVEKGTLAQDDMSTEEGLARFEAALSRLSKAAPTTRHPMFGRLTADEWTALHLRHAECHLGVFRVE